MKTVIRRETTTPAAQRREARERAERAARAAVRAAAFSGVTIRAELPPRPEPVERPRRTSPAPSTTPAGAPRLPRQREAVDVATGVDDRRAPGTAQREGARSRRPTRDLREPYPR
jgi:hypothetical protein